MKTLPLLIVKDLRRVLRNPVPILIFTLIPLLITATIGLVFGGQSDDGGPAVAPLRLGVVDQDGDGLFSRMLRSMVGQDDFRKHVDARFLEQSESMTLLGKGELSAVLIIPEGFSRAYLAGKDALVLTLVKNPSEWVYPTLAQEGMEVLVAGLNVLARHVREDLVTVSEFFDESRDFDLLRDGVVLMELGIRTIDRVEAVREYLVPPVIAYTWVEAEVRADESSEAEQPFNVFGYILPGMLSMFLLLHADNGMRDLYREARWRTLDRFRSMRGGLLPVVLAKVVFAVLVLGLVSVLLLGIGSVAFGIAWKQPLPLAGLIAGYCLFAAGWAACLGALAGREKRADIVNNLTAMGMAICGGAMVPSGQLPVVVQKWVTPWMPTHWFSEAFRTLQGAGSWDSWQQSALVLVLSGGLMVLFASWLYTFKLERGIRE
jgi:hypothetical protein